jgi:hypothetical protein
VCASRVRRNSPGFGGSPEWPGRRGGGGVKDFPEVMVVQWKPQEEWQPTLPSEPTSLASTLRPAVPVFTSHFMKTPVPLTLEQGEKLTRALRRSSLAWKEVQPPPAARRDP